MFLRACYGTAARAAPRPPPAQLTQILSKYESTTPRPLNLSQLLSFGRPVSPDSVLASASYSLYELPRRQATRVRFLESLPFIVGTNPYVFDTAKAFRESFYSLATHPPVRTLEENDAFVQMLSDIVQRHANDIPTMAKGYVAVSLFSTQA
jgi:26S proteasome regulatory subunit T1